MSEIYGTSNDPFVQATESKKIPSSLNILTILTFIGSAIGLIFTIIGVSGAKERYESTAKMMEDGSLEKMPGFMKNMITPEAVEVLRKTYENILPLTIIGLVSIALCIYGALEMRKLKKQGFYIYLVGEVLPLISSIIFIGMGAFRGLGMLSIGIPILFILLYASQLKYLR